MSKIVTETGLDGEEEVSSHRHVQRSHEEDMGTVEVAAIKKVEEGVATETDLHDGKEVSCPRRDLDGMFEVR